MRRKKYIEGGWSSSWSDGLHYNIFAAHVPTNDYDRVWTCTHEDTKFLEELFPDGQADEWNFILFGTSGVHGSYGSLCSLHDSFKKYGFEMNGEEEDWPDDYEGNSITFLVVHPRVVAMRYGNVKINSWKELLFLQRLQSTSLAAVKGILEDG